VQYYLKLVYPDDGPPNAGPRRRFTPVEQIVLFSWRNAWWQRSKG